MQDQPIRSRNLHKISWPGRDWTNTSPVPGWEMGLSNDHLLLQRHRVAPKAFWPRTTEQKPELPLTANLKSSSSRSSGISSSDLGSLRPIPHHLHHFSQNSNLRVWCQSEKMVRRSNVHPQRSGQPTSHLLWGATEIPKRSCRETPSFWPSRVGNHRNSHHVSSAYYQPGTAPSAWHSCDNPSRQKRV